MFNLQNNAIFTENTISSEINFLMWLSCAVFSYIFVEEPILLT